MANYQELKAAINVNVRKNGNEEITGDILNRVLNRMVDSLGGGYQLVGQATTQTDPGTPDNNVYYIATDPGTYTNFAGLSVNDGEFALLLYNGKWQKITVQFPSGGGNAGGGGGLELRELKMSGSADDNAYNLETLELIRENKVLPAIKPYGDVLTPALCLTEGIFLVRFFVEGLDAELLYSVESDGSVHQTTEIINGCHVITTAADFLAWKNSNDALTQGKKRTPAYIFREGFYCLVDSTRPTDTNGSMGLQFNANGKRYERVYSKAGEEISTTEIPIGGGGGGSVTVDAKLSKTSTNPVQNVVITTALEGKTDALYIYEGATDEEKAKNLEVLQALNNGFAGLIFIYQGDANCIAIQYAKQDGQWRFALTEIIFLAGFNAYMYIDEQGVLQLQYDESAIEDLFYGKVTFPYPLSNEHRKKLVDILINTNTMQSQLYTIAKNVGGNNDGAIYFTWDTITDENGEPMGVLAYYYDNGICVDTIDLDGKVVGIDSFPLRLRVGAYNDMGYYHIKNGGLDILIAIDNVNYHPISTKWVDVYDSSKGYYISIIRDLKIETYKLMPDGVLTLDSENSLIQTI